MTPSRTSWTLVLTHAAIAMMVGFALRPAISAELLDGGHSSAWLGVATMVFALPPLLIALPAGRIVDRTGERPWLIAGGVALVIAAALTLAATWLSGVPHLTVLIAANAMLGLGNLASVLGQQTWVMHGAAGDRPDFWFGLYTFAASVGQLAAPAVLWLPGADAGHSLATAPIAIAMAVASVAVAVVALALPPRGGRRMRGGASPRASTDLAGYTGDGTGPIDLRQAPEPGGGESAGERRPAARDPDGLVAATADLVRRRGVLRALIASSLVLASVDVVMAYLPLLTSERGLDPAWIGGLLMARAVAAMLSRLGLSRLTALAGRRPIMVTGATIAALALGLMALPVPTWALVVGMAAYGFAAGTVQPLTMSWMTLITPPERRGLVTSLRMVGNRTGQSVVPLVIAGVSVIGGGALAFAVTAATLGISALASTTAPNGDRGRA